jgi:hypothetical protein
MDTSNPLGPIFAAGFAVQQFLEVLSPLVERFLGESRKKMALGVAGFIVGLGIASHFDLRALRFFNVANSGGWLDLLVTALILSAGTEGSNSIVKFLKYLKEDRKSGAAEKVQSLLTRTTGVVSPAATRTGDELRAGTEADAVARRSAAAAVELRADPSKMKAFSYISEK